LDEGLRSGDGAFDDGGRAGSRHPRGTVSFARFARLARVALHVPIALVAIADAPPERDAAEDATLHLLCAYVSTTGSDLVVEDADDIATLRVEHNGIGGDSISFAGTPLNTPDGVVLGSFCVVDTGTRRWSDEDLAALRDLADLAAGEIADAARRQIADPVASGAVARIEFTRARACGINDNIVQAVATAKLALRLGDIGVVDASLDTALREARTMTEGFLNAEAPSGLTPGSLRRNDGGSP